MDWFKIAFIMLCLAALVMLGCDIVEPVVLVPVTSALTTQQEARRAVLQPPSQPTHAEIERWHERWERARMWEAEKREGRYAQ